MIITTTSIPAPVAVAPSIVALAQEVDEDIYWCDTCDEWTTYGDDGYPYCYCS